MEMNNGASTINTTKYNLIMAAGSYSYGCQGLMTPISKATKQNPVQPRPERLKL